LVALSDCGKRRQNYIMLQPATQQK